MSDPPTQVTVSAGLVRTGAPSADTGRDDRSTTRTHALSAHGLLIAVSLGYLFVVALRTSQSMALTWDEVVYLSQVVRDVPAASFSAPRSRGMPWLLAPVAAFTSDIFPIRVYISVVSGLLLYVAFRPWLGVTRPMRSLSPYVPPLAAGLFATLWITTLYGTMGYPNLWLAFALVAGVGHYCAAVQQARITVSTAIAIGAAFAVASLLRPIDAVAAAGPLLIGSLVIRNWRRTIPAGAMVVGLTVGWGAWIVEAFQRFGGPVERLRQGAEINEGGITWSLSKYLESLDGPYLLCRPPDLCADVSVTAAAWWVLLPALVAIGLIASRRDGSLNQAVVVAACALSIALPYFLLFDYAAPRFLLPTYALLALPTAAAILWLANRPNPFTRVAATMVLVVGLVGHVVIQQRILDDAHEVLLQAASNHAAQARHLSDTYGVESPCLMVGEGAIQQSYLLRCASSYATGATIADREAEILEALASGHDVVVRLRANAELPTFLADWERVDLPRTDNYVAHLPPTNSTVE